MQLETWNKAADLCNSLPVCKPQSLNTCECLSDFCSRIYSAEINKQNCTPKSMRKFPLLKMKEKWNLFVESWKSIDTMYAYIY